MRMIDVFGVLPAQTLGKKNDLPEYPKKGTVGNGIWQFDAGHGQKYVIAREGTTDATGNWSGCAQSIPYDVWVKGGKINPCTGEPFSGGASGTPAPTPPIGPPKPMPAPVSSGVHPAIIAGGVGAAGFVALVATGVVKL